jgi:hypothetical protein
MDSHHRSSGYEPDELLLLYPAIEFGGPDKDRTCDIQLAKLALSQLSYRPIFIE